jgi:hypothetical protein
MRQNSALQLAKLEKLGQQFEKRLGIIEAKVFRINCLYNF